MNSDKHSAFLKLLRLTQDGLLLDLRKHEDQIKEILEKLSNDRYDEGYEAGYEDGFEAGAE